MDDYGTVATMTPPKKRPRGRPKKDVHAPPLPAGTARLFIELDVELKNALLAAARKEKRTLKAQAEIFFREILTAKGYLEPEA
jgi:hypothetical protein